MSFLQKYKWTVYYYTSLITSRLYFHVIKIMAKCENKIGTDLSVRHHSLISILDVICSEGKIANLVESSFKILANISSQ